MRFPTLCSLFSSGLLSCTALSSPLQIGDAIPTVSAPDQSGATVALQDLAGEEWALIFFYPKAGTPGCTKQACSLRDAYTTLTEAGVKVIGVSADKPEAQKAFATEHNLPFPLLADQSFAVIRAFKVPQLKILGGYPKRQAFLFHQGKLIWKDEKASTTKQAEDVLKVIQEH